MIDGFHEEYRWLSNFWPAKVELDGVEYTTVEHAYQAAKTIDPMLREPFTKHGPGNAKYMGRGLRLRTDWEDVKVGIMKSLLVQKFAIPELKAKLEETKGHELVEGNWWNDTFWGVCKGEGLNMLGKLLMEIRDAN